jgi:hypothetical protein
MWTGYFGSWITPAVEIADKDGLANSIVKLVKTSSKSCKIYLNGTLIIEKTDWASFGNYPYIAIGSSAGQTFHGITITRCRIYEEV